MQPPSLNVQASNPLELLRALEAIDITVPLIFEGRTTQHRERYLMAYFLAAFANSQRIKYPLSVLHEDRPDFVLETGEDRIAIECVEAVPKEAYQIAAINERDYPDRMTFGQKFKVGKQQFSREEIRSIASGEYMGPPWPGNEPERNWAEAMTYFISDKVEKLRAGNYAGYAFHWLLIQDEWRAPVWSLEEKQEALGLMLPQVQEWLSPPTFDYVFIHSGGFFFEVNKSGFEHKATTNLWSHS